MDTNWAAYGPLLMTRMTSEIQSSANETSGDQTFHVLPACFFEGVISSNSKSDDEDIAYWENFFGPEPEEKVLKERNYIDPRGKPHSTFGYHWHNRWEKPWLPNSLAEASEKLYCISAPCEQTFRAP